jgi:hypothetical protein
MRPAGSLWSFASSVLSRRKLVLRRDSDTFLSKQQGQFKDTIQCFGKINVKIKMFFFKSFYQKLEGGAGGGAFFVPLFRRIYDRLFGRFSA